MYLISKMEKATEPATSSWDKRIASRVDKANDRWPSVAPQASARDIAANRVRNAWMNPGRAPEYHYRMQANLRSAWPVLADALDALGRR